jgi:hypothetical protein
MLRSNSGMRGGERYQTSDRLIFTSPDACGQPSLGLAAPLTRRLQPAVTGLAAPVTRRLQPAATGPAAPLTRRLQPAAGDPAAPGSDFIGLPVSIGARKTE